MKNDVAIMKVGNGHTRDENGRRVKIYGYAPRTARALVALLKEHGCVEMTALGESSVNNMVKAIAHAQVFLQEENKELKVEGFRFAEASMNDTDGNEMTGKLVVARLSIA